MKVITNTTTKSELNAKAGDLALLVRLYNKCLFPTDDLFNGFIEQLKKVIEDLNNKYPRTKPFELYSVSEWGITISVVGSPDKVVASLNTATIKAFTNNQDIIPIEKLIIINDDL